MKKNAERHMDTRNEEIREPGTVGPLGAIVRSKQGRDRFRTFAVIALDFDNPVAPLIVADGRLHPAARRKHKNPAHVELLGMPVEKDRKRLAGGADDVEIAEICLRYEKLLGNEKLPLDKEPPDDL